MGNRILSLLLAVSEQGRSGELRLGASYKTYICSAFHLDTARHLGEIKRRKMLRIFYER